MGNRIKKTMGWGIELPDSISEEIIKPLFVKRSEDASGYLDYLETMMNEAVDSEDRETAKLELSIAKHSNLGTVKNSQIVRLVSMEYSEKGTFLVIIPFYQVHEFHRNDDIIDYYSFDQSLNIDDAPFVKYLENGIFPDNDVYVDKRTLKIVPNEVVRIFNFLKSPNFKETDTIDNICKKYEYESLEEYTENVVPKVPFSVRSIAEWMGVFGDRPEMINDLRPMLLTYWN